jgi:superfamily II helicase
MLANGNATMSEVGVIVDDEVGGLILSDRGKGVDTLLHEDTLYFLRKDSMYGCWLMRTRPWEGSWST